MLRTKKIPSKPRFDYARDRAYKLLVRLGVTQFPVDPFWVEDYFPDIHVLKCT
ncbi:hypothetical protein FACS1894188_08980 [Clostridia bacterium]|nr:hypothetical protein FACS1894188_08980 [Clostridia bacterium]